MTRASGLINILYTTKISPNFLVRKFCGNLIAKIGLLPETLRKLCVSTKFAHQEIR